jgi:hypothetical protein
VIGRVLLFTREQLRGRLTLALLVLVPIGFVWASAGVLAEFATALGGDLAGDAAAALGAGWAAAFVAGMSGFFAASSARQADRRLAASGAGAASVALSRIAATVVMACIATVAAFAALWARVAPVHPWHVLAAIAAFACVYAGIGVLVGAVIPRPLEGSLVVVFIFLLDAFAGPGMESEPALWSVSRGAGQVLVDAGMGMSSPPRSWGEAMVAMAVALLAAFAAFAWAARRRG